MAGVAIIRAGDMVIDGSVRGRLGAPLRDVFAVLRDWSMRYSDESDHSALLEINGRAKLTTKVLLFLSVTVLFAFTALADCMQGEMISPAGQPLRYRIEPGARLRGCGSHGSIRRPCRRHEG